MSYSPMTKQQAHAAFALVHKFAMTWTSHKTWCARLLSEVRSDKALDACTCGYFESQEQFEKELSKIRSGNG